MEWLTVLFVWRPCVRCDGLHSESLARGASPTQRAPTLMCVAVILLENVCVCFRRFWLKRCWHRLRTVVRYILAMTASIAEVLAAISESALPRSAQKTLAHNAVLAAMGAGFGSPPARTDWHHTRPPSPQVGGCLEREAAQGLSRQRCASGVSLLAPGGLAPPHAAVER